MRLRNALKIAVKVLYVLPGMAMGILMLKMVQNGLEMGLNTCVYFVLMGLICRFTSRNKGDAQ